MDIERVLAADRALVWHPYAPMPARVPPLVVESASGVRLRLGDGREVVDGMSSWWAAIHGYAHPALDAAVREQLGVMSLEPESARNTCSRPPGRGTPPVRRPPGPGAAAVLPGLRAADGRAVTPTGWTARCSRHGDRRSG